MLALPACRPCSASSLANWSLCACAPWLDVELRHGFHACARVASSPRQPVCSCPRVEPCSPASACTHILATSRRCLQVLHRGRRLPTVEGVQQGRGRPGGDSWRCLQACRQLLLFNASSGSRLVMRGRGRPDEDGTKRWLPTCPAVPMIFAAAAAAVSRWDPFGVG